MKYFLLIIVAAFSLGHSAFAKEVSFGRNTIVCENELGKFEVSFLVQNKVIGIPNSSGAQTADHVPRLEILQSSLTDFSFTSGGDLMTPDDAKINLLKFAKLTVVRNVTNNASNGTIDLSLSIDEKAPVATEALFIDHNHPLEYQSSELGAQAFFNFEDIGFHVLFECK